MAMEIISRESIKPSSPTADHLRTFRLSFLDKFITNFHYFTHILYYDSHDNSTTSIDINQAEISPLLKRSLSDALALYYPFAGRLKCESSVDCDDQGVDFFEARVDAYLSDIIESSTSAEVLTKFVPTTSAESGDGALLGIQLNYFNCGGIAIGITLCHRIGDACTLSMFVKTWAAMARGDTNTAMAPSFVASTLFPPKDAPGYQIQMTSEKSPEHWGQTRRFCFSSSKIAALRAAVEASTVVQVVEPTRVEVVTAAIWKWFMARKGRGRCGSSKASHLVNIRRRMDPPLSEFVFGNLAVVVDASGNGEMELGELVSKMREATGKIDSEFLKELQGENGYHMTVRDIKKMEESYSDKEMGYVMFSSWCKFPIYETDFGWGKPVWVSMAGRNLPNNITLLDSVSDIGGIEAWIATDEDCTHDEF